MPFPFFYLIRLDNYIEYFVKDLLIPNTRVFFQVIKLPVDVILGSMESFLLWLSPLVLLAIVLLLAWRLLRLSVAIISVVALMLVGYLGLWNQAMTTLAMILTAVIFCAIVGIPLGILAARSERFESGLRPVLDAMQTIPAFVYLVPIVMLFGVGIVPGVIATIIFSLPPIVRLTNLGIRQVHRELVEAAYSFGATPRQVLFEVQVPLAVRSIMAGLNQTLMLALSMVVIAALIGAGGLGETVYVGLGRNDVGLAAIGGLGIVILAIVLDRLTQAITKPRRGRANGFISRVKVWLQGRNDPDEPAVQKRRETM